MLDISLFLRRAELHIYSAPRRWHVTPRCRYIYRRIASDYAVGGASARDVLFGNALPPMKCYFARWALTGDRVFEGVHWKA